MGCLENVLRASSALSFSCLFLPGKLAWCAFEKLTHCTQIEPLRNPQKVVMSETRTQGRGSFSAIAPFGWDVWDHK